MTVLNLLIDTVAMHCFICARLAPALGLRPSGQPDPTSITRLLRGGGGGARYPSGYTPGDTIHKSTTVSLMDMEVRADLILQ